MEKKHRQTDIILCVCSMLISTDPNMIKMNESQFDSENIILVEKCVKH